jgi:hypothetical protein
MAAATPAAGDRRAVFDVLSGDNIEQLLTFTHEEQATDAVPEGLTELLGSGDAAGTYTVGPVALSARHGPGWKWRRTADARAAAASSSSSSSSSWLPLDDPRFPSEGDRRLAAIRETLETPAYRRFAAHSSRQSEATAETPSKGRDAVRKAVDAARDNKRVQTAIQYASVAAKFRDGEPIMPWIVRAVLVGFLDGATFGLVSGVLDAVGHDTCAAHRAKVSLAFGRAARAVTTLFRGLFGPPEARAGRTRVQLFRAAVTQLACFFKSLVAFVWRCRPLLVTLGMLVAVIGAALVINLALVATGYGIIVKIVEIVLTLFGLFSTLKKSVLTFAAALGRCTGSSSSSRCAPREILTMVEALTETIGLLVGAVYLSGITKLVRVRHVREALASRNARLIGFKLDPELSLRVAQFARKVKDLRAGVAAARSAVQTKSIEPLRAATRAARAQKRTAPASEVYASARSLADDAREGVRLEQQRSVHYTAAVERLSKQVEQLKAAGDGAGFTRANKAYLSMANKASTSAERLKAAEYAMQSAQRNVDGFVKGYAQAFGGARPSVRLVDDAVGRFRKVHAADLEIEAATVSAWISASNIKALTSMHTEGTVVNQYAARQTATLLAGQMGQISTKLVSQADDVRGFFFFFFLFFFFIFPAFNIKLCRVVQSHFLLPLSLFLPTVPCGRQGGLC